MLWLLCSVRVIGEVGRDETQSVWALETSRDWRNVARIEIKLAYEPLGDACRVWGPNPCRVSHSRSKSRFLNNVNSVRRGVGHQVESLSRWGEERVIDLWGAEGRAERNL